MNKQILLGGLTALVLTGCVSEPKAEIPPRADIPYIETREGYFIEKDQRYFGKDGKRFLVQTDDKGVEKRFPMKYDGKEYYPYVVIDLGIIRN